MKTCTKCNQSKEDCQFNFRDKNKGVRHGNCKDCQKIVRQESYQNNKEHYLAYEKIHTKKRREDNRKFITEFKTNKPCKDCNEVYPPYVMDFDHLPQFKKEIKIAKEGYFHSRKVLLEEFAKCELVCANCHRERTYKRKNGGH